MACANGERGARIKGLAKLTHGGEGGGQIDLKQHQKKKKSVIATGIIYVYVSEAICTVYISTVHTCIHTHVWMDERGPCAAVSDGDSIALEPGWSGLKS